MRTTLVAAVKRSNEKPVNCLNAPFAIAADSIKNVAATGTAFRTSRSGRLHTEIMEVYYKELISEDGTLDKLIDELTRVVQGADELAEAAARAQLPQETTRQIRNRLNHLKESCNRLKEHALAGAAATDKIVRRYPYSSLSVAFALGIITASLFWWLRDRDSETASD